MERLTAEKALDNMRGLVTAERQDLVNRREKAQKATVGKYIDPEVKAKARGRVEAFTTAITLLDNLLLHNDVWRKQV